MPGGSIGGIGIGIGTSMVTPGGSIGGEGDVGVMGGGRGFG